MRNIFILLVSVFLFSSISLFAQFGGRAGTKANPYRIYTQTDGRTG